MEGPTDIPEIPEAGISTEAIEETPVAEEKSESPATEAENTENDTKS